MTEDSGHQEFHFVFVGRALHLLFQHVFPVFVREQIDCRNDNGSGFAPLFQKVEYHFCHGVEAVPYVDHIVALSLVNLYLFRWWLAIHPVVEAALAYSSAEVLVPVIVPEVYQAIVAACVHASSVAATLRSFSITGAAFGSRMLQLISVFNVFCK